MLPIVSVIIPIYNVEKYIVRCIESVRKQTYSNLQVILVDDGSPDQCPDICDEYVKIDNRIEVIHKKNGGLSHARNVGMAAARGEYIYFLDADDYIEDRLIETCVHAIERCKADVVVFNYVQETELQEVDYYSRFEAQEFMFDTLDDNLDYIASVQVNYSVTGWNVWNRFYRRNLVMENALSFPDNNIVFAEDLAFALRISLYQKKIVVLNDCLYHYVRQSESITKKMKKNPIEKFVNLCIDFDDFAKERKLERKTIFAHVFTRILFNELKKECSNYHEMISELSKVSQKLQKYVIEWFKMSSNRPFRTINLYGVRFYCETRMVYIGLAKKNEKVSPIYWILKLKGGKKR